MKEHNIRSAELDLTRQHLRFRQELHVIPAEVSQFTLNQACALAVGSGDNSGQSLGHAQSMRRRIIGCKANPGGVTCESALCAAFLGKLPWLWAVGPRLWPMVRSVA